MAKKETNLEKIQRLCIQQKNIRNIATSAHIHHGKCIAPNSRLILSNGELKTARQLFEEISSDGKVFQENEEHTIFMLSKPVSVFSLNKTSGKIEKKNMDYAWRLNGGKTIKLKLRNGFEIETTPEHKYIAFRDGFEDVEAKNLKLGDRIVCARELAKYFLANCVFNKNEILQSIEINNIHKTFSGLLLQIKTSISAEDLAFVEVKSIEESFQEVVYDFTIPETHNFIAEGMVIHNTALTDNLLAASGYMAAKNAGDLEEGMATWQHSDEQERLLTVDAANVSMVHDYHNQEYLINLIDTPGHIDFSGNVTRAMRAIDGTIVLVCASEGIMPQTETVIKQAIRERVKPVLFINKMDRLIKELKLTPEGIQQRLLKIITDFNILISQLAEPEFKKSWQVDVNDGSVAFGSARDNWALSVPFMKKKNISFKDVLNIYSMNEDERKDWCWKNAPLYEVLLDMVIKHLPSPIEAQKYRIPKIWHGDLETEFGKDLLHCNAKGKLAFVITRIVIEPRSGKEVCAGRLFSGTVKNGMEIYLNMAKSKQRVQQVLIYNGIKPEQMEEIPAGNVLAIAGITGEAGETITLEAETAFEELKHIFEPVITKSISVPKPQDLPKLIDVLKKVAKEDPSIKVQINEETGENLISGMGELHLEIIENRIKTEKNVDVVTGEPIVVYRETVDKPSDIGEGKSPNKHNLFFLKVEPLEQGVLDAIRAGEISEGRRKKKDEALWKKLSDLGISNEEARQYTDVYRDCVFLNKIKGEVNIGEVIELVLDAFEQVVDAGPIAREPCIKLKVSLVDIKLHEDAIHRGPAQVYPAVRDAIRMAMSSGKPVLFEPLQILLFEGPLNFMSQMTKLIQSKRGQLIDVQQTAIDCTIKAKMPVAEMIGLASDLRSATEGRGNFSMVDQSFEKMPSSVQEQIVRQIRTRKGLAENE
jgi:elongation factor 2